MPSQRRAEIAFGDYGAAPALETKNYLITVDYELLLFHESRTAVMLPRAKAHRRRGSGGLEVDTDEKYTNIQRLFPKLIVDR